VIQLITPEDFLAMCYTFSDLFAILGSMINEVLEFFGTSLPDLRPVCLDIYNALV